MGIGYRDGERVGRGRRGAVDRLRLRLRLRVEGMGILWGEAGSGSSSRDSILWVFEWKVGGEDGWWGSTIFCAFRSSVRERENIGCARKLRVFAIR